MWAEELLWRHGASLANVIKSSHTWEIILRSLEVASKHCIFMAAGPFISRISTQLGRKLAIYFFGILLRHPTPPVEHGKDMFVICYLVFLIVGWTATYCTCSPAVLYVFFLYPTVFKFVIKKGSEGCAVDVGVGRRRLVEKCPSPCPSVHISLQNPPPSLFLFSLFPLDYIQIHT